jgi:hypothetical protein
MRLILSLTALLIASVAPAAAQYRAVTVDASAIAAQGYPTFARRVEAAVAPAVASVFADRVNPESENDYMVSEGLVVDRQGRVVASASVNSPVQAWTTVASLPVEVEEHRRMRQLGLHAAGWLRNRLGGL